MAASNPIRVIVVARDNLTRAGLAALISELAEFSVSGQVDSEDNLPGDVDLYEPEVVVWDVSEGPEHLTVLRDVTVPVIVIVPDGETAGIAWNNGARGILPRNVKSTALAAALTAAAEGLTTFDARFADAIESSSASVGVASIEALTERELQVLELVAEGMSNKAIASQLNISEHTVKFHVNSILTKLGTQSRTGAVTLATRLGLIKL